MGLMDNVMGHFDEEEGKKRAEKDISKYQEPMNVEDFLKMVDKKSNPSTPVVTANQTQPQAPQGPSHSTGISDNPFRPKTLDEFIGQDKAKKQIQMFVDGAKQSGKPFPHTLLATGAGMGKTTLATIIAEELARPVFVEKAPVSTSRLLSLGKQMQDGDVLLLDEVHLQAKGRVAGNSPEALYHIMEDSKILTEQGLFNYPHITIIGCTTDVGLLPKSMADRFTMRPPIVEYTTENMRQIADMNAKALEMGITQRGKDVFANAGQWTPRLVNNYVKQAGFMAGVLGKADIDFDLATLVLENQGVEPDGLTHQHMRYLKVLGKSLRWFNGQKEWQARASLKTITFGLGIADLKFVEREVEPLLIKLGLIRIGAARELTDLGFDRIGETRPVGAP